MAENNQTIDDAAEWFDATLQDEESMDLVGDAYDDTADLIDMELDPETEAVFASIESAEQAEMLGGAVFDEVAMSEEAQDPFVAALWDNFMMGFMASQEDSGMN